MSKPKKLTPQQRLDRAFAAARTRAQRRKVIRDHLDEPIPLRPTGGLLVVAVDVLRVLEPLDVTDRRRVLLAIGLLLRHDQDIDLSGLLGAGAAR